MSIKITISNRAFFLICFFGACALLLCGAVGAGVLGALLVVGGVLAGAFMMLAAWEEALTRGGE